MINLNRRILYIKILNKLGLKTKSSLSLFKGIKWNTYANFCICLSFDVDYPEDEKVLPALLEILNEKNIKASFAVIGFMIEQNPQLYKAISKHRHELINHSYSHPYHKTLNSNKKWLQLSKQEIHTEISKAHNIISDLTGYTPLGFRTPHFDITNNTIPVLKNLRYLYDSSGYYSENPPTYSLPFFINNFLQLPIYRKAGTFSFRTNNSFNFSRWENNIKKIIELESQRNGLIILYIDPKDIENYCGHFSNLLSYMLNKQGNFKRLIDIAQMFSKKVQ